MSAVSLEDVAPSLCAASKAEIVQVKAETVQGDGSAASSPMPGDCTESPNNAVPPDDKKTSSRADGMVWCGAGSHWKQREECSSWVKRNKNGNTVYYKCFPCNAQKKRQADILCHCGAEAKKKYKSMTPQGRLDFLEENKDKVAADVAAQLKNTVAESDVTLNSDKNIREGDAYDSEDLEKEFGHKPTQLEALKRNCPTFVHPQRECTMYVVDNIKTHAENEQRNEHKHERRIEQRNDKFKKATKIPKDQRGQKTANAGK